MEEPIEFLDVIFTKKAGKDDIKDNNQIKKEAAGGEEVPEEAQEAEEEE